MKQSASTIGVFDASTFDRNSIGHHKTKKTTFRVVFVLLIAMLFAQVGFAQCAGITAASAVGVYPDTMEVFDYSIAYADTVSVVVAIDHFDPTLPADSMRLTGFDDLPAGLTASYAQPNGTVYPDSLGSNLVACAYISGTTSVVPGDYNVVVRYSVYTWFAPAQQVFEDTKRDTIVLSVTGNCDNYTCAAPGVYPPVLETYEVGTPYADTAFVVGKPDTSYFLGYEIDSIVIVGVTGLPPGIAYTCASASCAGTDMGLGGNPHATIYLSGTPTAPPVATDSFTIQYGYFGHGPGGWGYILTDSSKMAIQGTCPGISTVVDSAQNVSCLGGTDGYLAVSSSTGTAPHTYNWSNGASGNAISNLAAATYTTTVTDAYGCTDTYSSSALAVGCDAPSGLTYSMLTPTSIRFEWDEVCGVSTYRIYFKEAGSSTWSSTFKYNGGTQKTINGLTPNTVYKWKVRSQCGGSWSGFSSVERFETLLVPCNVPTGLTATPVGLDKARLNWDNSTAVTYAIRYRVIPGGSWTTLAKSGGNTHHWLTDLASGTTYQWQMLANCQQGPNPGNSGWSAKQTFTTAGGGTAKQQLADIAAAEQMQPLATLFPNPTAGQLTVQLGQDFETVTIQATNAMGQVVCRTRQHATNQVQMELPRVAGLYFVRIEETGQVLRAVVR